MDDFLENMRNDHTDFDFGGLDGQLENIQPTVLFQHWLKKAYNKNCPEPNAMIISTVDENNRPSSRVVYLKEWTSEGLVFYTNYNSKKARDIAVNQNVSALFFWEKLARQVHVSGKAIKIAADISDEYFETRPRASKIGAWASRQSEPLESRNELEIALQQAEEKFKNQAVPRPDFWGGFVIQPNYFEFWQGRPSRLHDRICFQLNEEKKWIGFRRNP